MTKQQIKRVKLTIGYTEPTPQPCRDCRYCFNTFSFNRGEEAECGVAARTPDGRFPVHPWATCDRFDFKPNLVEEKR